MLLAVKPGNYFRNASDLLARTGNENGLHIQKCKFVL